MSAYPADLLRSAAPLAHTSGAPMHTLKVVS